MEKEPEKNQKNSEIEYVDTRGFVRVHTSMKNMLVNNFFGGIAWGLGTVIGATIIVGLLIFILGKLDTVPYIGDFINSIIEEIQNSR